jgi:hypothetical protein
MKDFIISVSLLLLLASEAALWFTNPMHIPAAFLPARAGVGLAVLGRRAEGYLRPATAVFSGFMPRLTIPAGSYFVLGDNRDQSEDSRNNGVIPRERIIGKRWL